MRTFRYVLKSPSGLEFYSNKVEYPTPKDMLIALEDGFLGCMGQYVVSIEEREHMMCDPKIEVWRQVTIPQLANVTNPHDV